MYFISFSILFYFFPILRVTAILAKCNGPGQFLQQWFCSVTSHAFLKQSIEVILRIELKQSYCEILESVSAELSHFDWVCCCPIIVTGIQAHCDMAAWGYGILGRTSRPAGSNLNSETQWQLSNLCTTWTDRTWTIWFLFSKFWVIQVTCLCNSKPISSGI